MATSSRAAVARLLDPNATDAEVMDATVAFYAASLPADPDAQRFLAARGLDDAELITHFRLGVANRTLGLELPGKRAKGGKLVRTRLKRLRIYRSSGHEHLNGSLVVPVADERGRVVDLYGRKLRSNLRAGTPLHLFLHDEPQLPFFHVAALADAKQLIVTGGIVDALTFWRHGLRQVVGLFGAATFDHRHAELFSERGIERVVLAYRRDADGDRASKRAAALLTARGIEVFGAVFARGEDANDTAVAAEDPRDALLSALRHVEWLGAGEPSSLPWLWLDGVETDEEAPLPVVTPTATLASLARVQAQRSASPEQDARRPSPSVVSPPPPPVSGDEAAADSQCDAKAFVDDTGDQVTLALGDRLWRVRGLAGNTAPNSLKVTLAVVAERGTHVDVVQLLVARQRKAFARDAAEELGVAEAVIKRDLGKLLFELETLQAELIAKALEPAPAMPALSDAERDEAMALLQDPALLDRIVEDAHGCGLVGEATNILMVYLAATSRLLPRPIGVVVRSSSAGGKTTLTDAVLAMMPPESRVTFSAMTGQSLYYMGPDALKHRTLSIAEDEGARRAAYALKLLQSEGRLTIASTTKDGSGRMATEEYVVEGPTQLMMTTTAVDVDEELLNRCVVLSVDESREQTRAIHQRQRQARTLDGIVARREREQRLLRHNNAQRLLEPLVVVNPYAPKLRFVDFAPRTRRDHDKYLALIDAVALLRQHQRPVKTKAIGPEALRYIEVEPDDIAVANALADEVLGRSLDELPPQSRALLSRLDEVVDELAIEQGIDRRDVRFTVRQLRERTRWADTQLRTHLGRLVRMEYVLDHGGGRGALKTYELLWDRRGDDGRPRLNGLIDPRTLA